MSQHWPDLARLSQPQPAFFHHGGSDFFHHGCSGFFHHGGSAFFHHGLGHSQSASVRLSHEWSNFFHHGRSNFKDILTDSAKDVRFK